MLLPVLKRQGNPLLAMTGRERSTLAREADVHLDVSVPAEACPLHLAPTSSTTARSEEHTSELQSLMRISYAVFCLKKNTTDYHTAYEYRPQTTIHHTHESTGSTQT